MRSIFVFLMLLTFISATDAKAQGLPYYSWPWLSNPYLQPGRTLGYPAVPYQMGVPGVYPPAYFSLPTGRGPNRMLPNRPLHLCQIVKGVERKGYDPIVEVEFEDDVWEVEAYRYGQLYELKVNPFSGHILSAELDEDESDEDNEGKQEGAE